MSSSSCDCCENLSRLGLPICNASDSASLLEAQEETGEELAVKLPGIITVNESCDCKKYPKVNRTKLKNMFPKMCLILNNLYDYEQNILSFWILDVFIEGLKTTQEAGMDHESQKTTLLWIAFMFNHMQLHDLSRSEMFKYLFDLILPLPQRTMFNKYFGEFDIKESAEKIIDVSAPEDRNVPTEEEVWEIPLPPELSSKNSKSKSVSSSEKELEKSNKQFNKREFSTETNIQRMKVILEILYRIFGRFWVFKALTMIFHQTPKAKIVDLPFTLHTPKPAMTLDPPHSVKSGRSQKKPIVQEEIDSSSLKNDCIYPLQLAEGAKTFVRELFNIPSNEGIQLMQKKTKK